MARGMVVGPNSKSNLADAYRSHAFMLPKRFGFL
jgi:hypothetical protein